MCSSPNEGFVDQERRFGCAPADWFVIGGRWSGTLTRMMLDKKKVEQFYKEFEKKYGWHTNSEIKRKDRKKQAKKLFKKYFPNYTGELIFWRDTYKDLGYEDDAMIITPQIYDELLKEHEGSYEDGEHFWDLDYDEVNPETYIGKKWIVCIDYHS